MQHSFFNQNFYHYYVVAFVWYQNFSKIIVSNNKQIMKIFKWCIAIKNTLLCKISKLLHIRKVNEKSTTKFYLYEHETSQFQ